MVRFDLMKEQEVILVNERDEPLGAIEKMQAHEKGLLHRAFSVFIFDSKGKILLQQRSAEKYHGANLWTNACCSHPLPGENVEDAAQRRLNEELGFIASLEKIFSFTYYAPVENNLIEHEFDHVFAGEYENIIIPNPHEVSNYVYKTMEQVKNDIDSFPEKFTSWFKIAFPKIEEWWMKKYEVRSKK
jgi:isopentenyl-diphosphate delta-isomerase